MFELSITIYFSHVIIYCFQRNVDAVQRLQFLNYVWLIRSVTLNRAMPSFIAISLLIFYLIIDV